MNDHRNLENGILEIVHPNMAELSKTDQAMFAMLRRNGLGASDSAIYMGVNKWKTTDQLIQEKLSIGLTPEEIEVGNKEVVRKGLDLEPLIIQKFEEWSGIPTMKPDPMYRLIEHPQLTINFDGVADINGVLIPVECKFCSMRANNFWDRTKTINTLAEGMQRFCGGSSVTEHIELAGQQYGIPAYYYTQIQQQMLGLDAAFGYFAVLFDKGWEFRVYKIYKDDYVQHALISESAKVWRQITERRQG